MSPPERLVQILTNKGSLPPASPWAEAVAQVRRELFLPGVIEADDRTVDRFQSPERWMRAVYGDLALVTQVNEGRELGESAYQRPTSSSSMPSIMLEMLDLLDAQPGQSVLEVGAGTGYNAALLSHRLGSANVTTVDIDGVLVERAEKNLTTAGYSPRVVRGNGQEGWAAGAPYDRLVATYTVSEIPNGSTAQATSSTEKHHGAGSPLNVSWGSRRRDLWGSALSW
ncbi:methyltransferase domain-containing protein [Streptomyces olivoreticuli]